MRVQARGAGVSTARERVPIRIGRSTAHFGPLRIPSQMRLRVAAPFLVGRKKNAKRIPKIREAIHLAEERLVGLA